MSPLPIIEDVYRCSLNYGTSFGVAPVNVIHVLATGSTATDVGESLFNAEQEGMLSPVPAIFEPISWTVLPLDGSSASVDRIRGVGAVEMTEAGSAEAVLEAAYILSFHTTVRGPRGRGRAFIGPIGESTTANGHVAGDSAAHIATAWTDFFGALVVDDVIPVIASYVHADFNPILNLQVRTGIGTQRRRLVASR